MATIQTGPRVFWKEHQHRFPALASLARDVLSIPATGAGVERLFNSARDVCHDRRGSLSPRTIRDLMLFMCTSRFDIKEEQRAMIGEYLSYEEIQADGEEKDTQASEFDPISDNDEGDEGDYIQIQQIGQAPSEKARGSGEGVLHLCQRKAMKMRMMSLLFHSLTQNSACQGEFGNAQDFSRDMRLNKSSCS